MLPTPGKANKAPADFSEFVGINERAVAAATRMAGWNARNEFSKRQTDLYFVDRFLRFERLRCQLRQFLLDVANELLNRAGRELGFRALTAAVAFPTLANATDAEARLRERNETYKTLLSRFRLY